MNLEALISQYGYYAVAIGSLVEGETIVLLGGISAHLGYLNLWLVMLLAFCGSVLGDQAYFFIGRFYGLRLLERHPRWHERTDRVRTLANEHSVWIVFACRFLYGLRIVTPFVLGMTKVSTTRFVVLNLISGVFWAMLVVGLGYLFGSAIRAIVGDIRRYEVPILIGVAIIGVGIWMVALYRERKRRRETPLP